MEQETDAPRSRKRVKRGGSGLGLLGLLLLLALCDDDDDDPKYCYTFGSERRCFERPLPENADCYLMETGSVQCFDRSLP